jgi:Permuted papain-like amidase enzyme, YaeF/YiiX, C92 family
MATALTKKQLEEEIKIDYKHIRPFLKTGQLVFCSGKYIFSGIIQRLTKSVWSHAAIIYKDEELDRIMVLEAEPYIGNRLIPLSKYLKDYNGTKKQYKGLMFIADLEVPLPKEKLNKAISFGLDELTRPYDNWEIVRIMLRILFKIGKKEKNRNYMCSELVKACYDRAGINFPLEDSYISPDRIWKDNRVEKKYRIL